MAQHGTDPFISPVPAAYVGAAEFYDFAPASCTCYDCLNAKTQKTRTYARIYENRVEYNVPSAPFMCLSNDLCVSDNVSVMYFDKPPFRVGVCCFCLPFTCC